MSSPDAPLMPVLLEFLAVSGIDGDDADARSGTLEHQLETGDIRTPDDLFAKARYLQRCGQVDPALIPMAALDTLVAGVVRLFGPSLTTPSLSTAAIVTPQAG
ncbi:hypothetical protein [Azospirillum griseum]|uniref:Uncharacterized protein n=1 Tax=Azospirillum griseum TaxID=2496639 RepID=A0A431VBZ9_9PROT|nr:hypothetical protein [Azospirillum griseum]RTR16182.1 hypothetical protein EJ903_21555 [Azospirillum griseum]